MTRIHLIGICGTAMATLAAMLKARGHDVRVQLNPNAFGRGQIIWRDPVTGVLTGGSESRTDGQVAAF